MELVCIHKSYVVYLEICVVPIGHDFHFWVMEKSWKFNVYLSALMILLLNDTKCVNNCIGLIIIIIISGDGVGPNCIAL